MTRLIALAIVALLGWLVGRDLEERWWWFRHPVDLEDEDPALLQFRQRLESEEFTDEPSYRITGI